MEKEPRYLELTQTVEYSPVPKLEVLEAISGFTIRFLRFGEWQDRVRLIDPGYPGAK